jgi:hypothetical protein
VKNEQKSHYAVLVYDDFLPLDGRSFNAVIARGYDRTDTVGYALCQRYILPDSSRFSSCPEVKSSWVTLTLF